MKTLLLSSAMVWISITLFSCYGVPGPVGPPGSDVVANISNTTFTIDSSSWSKTSSGSYQFIASVPAITDNNNDDVQCFIQVVPTDTWWSIPTTDLIFPGDNISFGVSNGNVIIDYFYSSTPTTNLNLRVVVIPPMQVAKMKLHNINLKDYYQIDAYLKLNSK